MTKATTELSGYETEMIKPKELIEVKGSGALTLQDRRLFNMLLNEAWGKRISKHGETFTIDTASLKDTAKQIDQNNQRLKKSLRRLMTTTIITVNAAGDDVETQLLGSRRITPAGLMHYSFPNDLADVLKDSSVFAKLDLEVMSSFSSKYAFALYEAVARRINMKFKHNENLDIEDMRGLLGVDTGKLSSYRNLRIKAIEPAVTEVNEITPYLVTIHPVKKGRKVVGFTLHWSVKDKAGMAASWQLLQYSKVGRSTKSSGSGETVMEE